MKQFSRNITQFLSDVFALPKGNQNAFDDLALKTFRYQAQYEPTYRQYLSLIKANSAQINEVNQIPFMPIQFFKTHRVLSSFASVKNAHVFRSSGTTSTQKSVHWVADLKAYERSCQQAFENHFGELENFRFFGLLPSYAERNDASLVYMVFHFMEQSKFKGDFYLNDPKRLIQDLKQADEQNQKCVLIGVSFALLDLAEQYDFPKIKNLMVMETGGMKGHRKELVREALHVRLKKGLKVAKIFSEYGMTELLSQAYTKGEEVFYAPNWMQFRYRHLTAPWEVFSFGKGGLNIIDLANIHSCSFLATDDLGDGDPTKTKVLGRFDQSDIRGCNLLVW